VGVTLTMNLTALFVQLVQLIKGLAAPIAVLVALYWFRKEIKAVLEALAYFIRERKFKGTFPGGSVEVGGGAEAELQKYIDASATPPPPTTAVQVQELVEAKKFILRDDVGRARAEIGMMGGDTDPYPTIRLFDTKGKVELQLFALDDGPSAIMLGTPKRSLVFLFAGEGEHSSSFFMRDSKDNIHMALTTDSFSLANGRVFLTGSADSKVTPLIALRNKDGEIIYRAP